MDGELGEAVRNSISHEGGYPHFRLCEGGRCPHLREDNLCRIICECGDGMLSDICREHPRFYNLSSDFCEVGVGLACPVGADLILGSQDHSLCEVGETDDEAVEEYRKEYGIYRLFFDTVCHIAQCASLRGLIIYTDYHTSHTMPDLLFELSIHPGMKCDIDHAFFLGRAITVDGPKDEVEEIEATLSILSSLEVLDEGYDNKLIAAWESVLANRDAAVEYIADNAERVIRLYEYFLYRHLHGGVEDGSTSARARFALISAISVMALSLRDGGRESIRDCAVDYSRNIEYSDSNIETFIELAEGDERFGIGFLRA
jgi:lysine-N-methylase